ncbi:Disease resistance protein L6 [Linum grandiflorum]
MRRMEQTNMWSGEVTAVSNPSSESQTSTAELHSVASAFEYEVFLSFRGPEVRNSFADFLYDHLFCSIIRTFRDEEELQKGETIAPSLVQAIKESKIYIPILSKSYASSKWCLQELAKMVECCGEGKGRIILPIFYFIDPRDVRHQAGPYEDAFEQHSKKHDPVTVQEWRTALQEVGHMKGWHVTEVVRDRQFWEDQLMELKDLCATNNKVQASLKISYDDLSCNAKNIFLDIACFFIGEDKELPFHMWSDCKRYPESGLRTLVLRSLIKVDERNQFWMHDLVRDLGRAIVIEEDVKNPCKRSRIWSYEDAMNVLKTKEGTDQVEMLKINMLDDDSNQKLTVKTFEKLARLKYLDMEFPRLTGDFSGILPDMRWLRLRGCQSLPTDLNLEKVVILDLEDCWVTDDWRGWSGIQVAHKLKVINLRGCYKLHKVPNLTQCENLEFIDLTNCFEMSGELRIGSFWNLKVVRHPWSGTIDLTGDMGKLQKLQEINTGKLVSGAQEIVLPTSLKCVTSSSPNISNLLDLKDLEELCFVHCDTVPEIPRDIWQLTKLKTLQLVLCFCNESLLVDKDGTLPPSLTSLIFKCCKHLNRLPNLGRLNNLMELRLVDVGVTEIHSLGELRMLEVLEISESHVGNLYGLDNLVQLKELTLKKCHRLENLPSLSNLIKLHSLVIIKCSLLCEIQGLVELRRSLLHLEVSYCDKLENIRFIESLEGLDSLTLDWKEILPRYGDDGQRLLAQAEDEDSLLIFCQYFNPHKPFPDLSRLLNLKQLSISWWRQLPEVTGLGRLISLKTLKMIGCTSLRRLPDLSGLKNLENLDVSCCMLLVDVTGVDRLESLQTLTFSDCWSLKELPDISSLKSLEELNVDECTELIKVAGLEKLEKLEKLRMRNCKSIKELPDMSGLKNLKELSLMGCTNLKKVKGLEALGHLPFFFMDRRLRAKYAFKRVVQAGRELKSAVRGVWDS